MKNGIGLAAISVQKKQEENGKLRYSLLGGVLSSKKPFPNIVHRDAPV